MSAQAFGCLAPEKSMAFLHPAIAALSDVPVSKFFRDAAWKSFPGLNKHPGYWPLFCYLLFGSWHDKDTGRLLLYSDILSEIEGRDPNNSQAEKFLIDFREEVLRPVGADIRWTDWYKPKRKCRQLRKRDFGLEFEEILRQEHLGKWNRGERVYLLDGSIHNRLNARRFRRQQREAAGRLPTFCEHAEFIRTYMNTLPANLFTTKVQENFRSALKATFNLPDSPVRDAQLRILRHINSQPQPFYFPSEKGHTVRLSTSEGIPNLKSNVRRALTKGWEEADLRCSQLAICASLWRIKEVTDFLATGKSIWNRLFDYLELRPEQRQLAKPILKKAIYSTCYGMEEPRVRGLTARDFAGEGMDKKLSPSLLKEELFASLFNSRDIALEQIAEEGGGMTAYGRWLRITGEREPRDIMAEVAQSWEMKLIYPAFDLARKTSDFTITLFQHDGISVQFTRRSEQWKRRIEESINENANRLNFMTWLEWS